MPHWTQTPEGKARMSTSQKQVWARKRSKRDIKAQRVVAKAAARFQSQSSSPSPTIVVQGWSITVVGNQLRIERES